VELRIRGIANSWNCEFVELRIRGIATWTTTDARLIFIK